MSPLKRTLLSAIISLVAMPSFANTDLLIIKLTCLSNGYYDETALRFTPGATGQFDSSYDAWKMFSPSPVVPSFWSKDVDMNDLSINSVDELVNDTVVDMFSTITVPGDHQITVSTLNVNTGVTLFMEDLETGTVYPLSASTSLTFNMNGGSGYVRFRIFVSSPMIVDVTDPTCPGGMGEITVADLGNSEFDYEVYDATMNLVAQNTGVNESETITGLPAGNYSVVATTNFGTIENGTGEIISATQSIFADFSVPTTIYMSTGAELEPINTSTGASTYVWNFGDGNTSSLEHPEHAYVQEGTYTVSLTAYENGCSDEHIVVVEVENDLATNIEELYEDEPTVYAHQNVLYLQTELTSSTTAFLIDMTGQVVHTTNIPMGPYSDQLVVDVTSGIYFMQIGAYSQKVYIQ